MSEKIIQTKRGLYGRVNVTLPLPVKIAMLAWAKNKGMKKAEFLRMALTTGFLELSKGIISSDLDQMYPLALGRPPASSSSEDGRPAKS